VVQSRFETLHEMADTSLVRNGCRSNVTSLLQRIDKALSALVSERKARHVEASEEQVSLVNRPMMRALVALDDEASFKSDHGFSEVKEAYKDILAWIVAELRDAPAPPVPAAATAATPTS
jgi:hypothetical protein